MVAFVNSIRQEQEQRKIVRILATGCLRFIYQEHVAVFVYDYNYAVGSIISSACGTDLMTGENCAPF